MANTKEVRKQIASIKGTQKITSAMEMVAASKMKKTQDTMFEGRPYSIKIKDLICNELKTNFNFTYSPYLESFETLDHLIIFDRDIFGMPEKKKKSWRRKTENFLKDLNTIEAGDLIAHIDHGIGLYDGLEMISSSGVDHDCLRLIYSGGDKLYLPVENMNLLSRVGDTNFSRDLDKLGAANWQNRKANVKKKIKDMAEKLIRVAAQREIISTEKLFVTEDYKSFSRKFPYQLTDDQERAINDVILDLETGKLMDRLICGCLLYTSPSPRDATLSRMPSSA